MTVPTLTEYWIKPPGKWGPLGFGVTAYSFDDAIAIIHAFEFGRYLPDEPDSLEVVSRIRVADLDDCHVVANMGPINVRGMWYPFVAVGVPAWAEERVQSRKQIRIRAYEPEKKYDTQVKPLRRPPG